MRACSRRSLACHTHARLLPHPPQCDLGQTVAFTKVRYMETLGLDAELALDPGALRLALLDGRELIDPLSLNDLDDFAPGACVVVAASLNR